MVIAIYVDNIILIDNNEAGRKTKGLSSLVLCDVGSIDTILFSWDRVFLEIGKLVLS